MRIVASHPRCSEARPSTFASDSGLADLEQKHVILSADYRKQCKAKGATQESRRHCFEFVFPRKWEPMLRGPADNVKDARMFIISRLSNTLPDIRSSTAVMLIDCAEAVAARASTSKAAIDFIVRGRSIQL